MNKAYTTLAALLMASCIYVKEYGETKNIKGIVKYNYESGDVYILAPGGEDSVEIYNEAKHLSGVREGTLVDVICRDLNRYKNKHGDFVNKEFMGLKVDTVIYNKSSPDAYLKN